MSPIRYLRDAAVFAPCYVVLDWASYIAPLGPFNITPWNPQPALAIVWMLLGGLGHAPVVLATIFGADLLVRGAPGGYGTALATSLALASAYTLVAWALRKRREFDWRLKRPGDLSFFVAVVTAGSMLGGGLFVGFLDAARLLPGDVSFAEAWLRHSVGDLVGIMVTAPLLLVAADLDRRKELVALLRRRETTAQALVVVLTLWLVFAGIPGDPARHFYLLFLPLIWIALRGGMNGAVLALVLVQLGVIVGIHRHVAAALPVVELQAIMATLTLTGLFLGILVDEHQRAAENYRKSLRFAASAETAGALAHELNQPLTAITNYGEAALMMLERQGGGEELARAIGRVLAESRRAADVVRRLRDFFRTGATRLEAMSGDDLSEALRRVGREVTVGQPVALDVDIPGDLPALYVDRLQVELVVRNLLSNALHAASGSPQPRIKVGARPDGPAQVRIVVADSGPGIPSGLGERVFEPFVSGKASGLGLGLAICRAIAEAHGGSLDARAVGHGEFHLVLPCLTTR